MQRAAPGSLLAEDASPVDHRGARRRTAGITVRRADALRILRTLADGAGPAAFLARIRLDTPTRGMLAMGQDDNEQRVGGM